MAYCIVFCSAELFIEIVPVVCYLYYNFLLAMHSPFYGDRLV